MALHARCSALDFACVLRAAWMLVVLNVAVRVLPARVLRSRPRTADRRSPSASPEQVVRAVSVAARFVGGTCLTRALVSRLLLAREGVPVTIALGAPESCRIAQFRAHAWIEHDGTPIVHGELVPAFPAVWRIDVDSVR